MRTAALPDFRKLYRRITEGDYAEGLPAGKYILEIGYSILTGYVLPALQVLGKVWGMAGEVSCQGD